jgi:hypothetical protein
VAFANSALGNLLTTDKARLFFTKTTLEQKDSLQSSPWVSPSPFVGVLQAMPPRSRSHFLRSPLPATSDHHGPLDRCLGTHHFTTDWVRAPMTMPDQGLHRGGWRRAALMAAAKKPATWMRLGWDLPHTSLMLQWKTSNSSPFQPPWLAGGENHRCSAPHLQRRKSYLLKKASPVLPLAPHYHLDGMVEDAIGEQPALLQSAGVHDLQGGSRGP